MTKISPEATEDDIVDLAKSCLQVEDVVAKALVPRGRPLATLTFLSFKVGVKMDLKSKAMDPCTWPPEIQFREFIDTSTNVQHFWKPNQRTDPGTSKIAEPQQTPASTSNMNQQQRME